MNKIIYLNTIFLLINCSQVKITGKYSGAHAFRATEIMLMEDHKFSLREFYDVGGWENPINGDWQLKADTLQLTSRWLPKITKVKIEAIKDTSHLTKISLWDSSGIPYFGNYEIQIGDIKVTKVEYDSIKVDNDINYPITYYYLKRDSLIPYPELININLNGAILTYRIDDLKYREFQIYIDAPEDSVFLRQFLDKDKWIIKGDTLFSIYNSELNRNYYLVKKNKKTKKKL